MPLPEKSRRCDLTFARYVQFLPSPRIDAKTASEERWDTALLGLTGLCQGTTSSLLRRPLVGSLGLDFVAECHSLLELHHPEVVSASWRVRRGRLSGLAKYLGFWFHWHRSVACCFVCPASSILLTLVLLFTEGTR
jgi:hypothetical protein